ncbi:MAG TPA: 1,4-dihydroxy-2-naphthoate octaprenyltransferase [Thermoplasmata archaeon]|nr:1,4-dihydroxy-2-naphthoate octaprenyltransferase [Thermoplasmata archaeon]
MARKPVRGEISVITCDMQGTVREYAADAAALFGWTEDEVVGKMSVAAFHVPKNIPTLVPRLLREAVEQGKFEEEVVLMRKDGSSFRAVLTVRPMVRDGKQVGYMGMTRPLEGPGGPPMARLWFQSLRAPFLVASLIPVLVGGLAAWQMRSAFNVSLFLLALIGATCIHLSANMGNDAWDYRSGNDLQVRHLNPFAGGGRVLIRGVLNLKVHLAIAMLFLVVGSAIGVYLVTQVGLPLLWLGLFGVLVAYSYVGPPLRLAHHGVGEIAVGLEFGPVALLGTYYVLTRTFDPAAVVLSACMGLLVTGILWINEVPDISADSAVGKRTLVVRLGVERATTVFSGIVAAAYVMLAVGVALFRLTPWVLLAFLALPLALQPVRGLRKSGGDPHTLIPSNAGMILTTLATGVLIAIGLAVEALIFP